MGVSLSFLPCTLIHPTVKGRGVENPWAPPWGTHPSVGCSAPPSQRVSLGCPGRLLFAEHPIHSFVQSHSMYLLSACWMLDTLGR